MKSPFRPVFVLLLIVIAIICSCQKLDIQKIMVIKTKTVIEITATTASVKGEVVDLGDGMNDYGVFYSTKANAKNGVKVSAGVPSGIGEFTVPLSGLKSSTKYYTCAYGSKNNTYVYGEEVSFTTLGLPTITTISVSSITAISASSGGSITSDGGTAITARGICWSTSPNPTIDLTTKTTNGTGTGTFTSSITGLMANTTYHLRAYANNSGGTAYGNEVIFITLNGVISLTTTAATSITATTASCGGSVTSDGGAAVGAKGVCWNTSTSPTIALTTKTINGSGTGTFTCNMTGLTPNTTYYVRSYATNNLGTAYGNEVSFTTTMPDGPGSNITDVDGNTYITVWIEGRLWMAENLKTTKYRDGSAIPNITDNTAWITQTFGAYCWYSNDISNKATYGALYNFYTVVDSRNLCPTGWHVPTDAEWTAIETYLGGSSVAGGKLKAIALWANPNTGADNGSGFTALPGGYRDSNNGFYYTIRYDGFWWSTTEFDAPSAWDRYLNYSKSDIYRTNFYKGNGFSVRCIRDL